MKYVGQIFLSLLFLFLIIIILLIFGLYTATGSKILLTLTQPLYQQQLNFQYINGSFDRDLELSHLNFKNQSLQLASEKVILQANLLKLFTGKLVIKKLILDHTQIHIAKLTTHHPHQKSNLIPHIKIKNASFNDTKIFYKKQLLFAIKNTHFNLNFNPKMDLNATFDLTTPQAIHLRLTTAGNFKNTEFALSATGKQIDFNFLGNANLDRIIFKTTDSKLLNNSIFLTGQLGLKSDVNSQIKFLLQQKTNKIAIEAAKKTTWTLNWLVHVENLNDLLPNLYGKINSNGAYAKNHLNLALAVSNFISSSFMVKNLNAKASYKNHYFTLQMLAHKINHENSQISALNLKSQGPLEAIQNQLSLQLNQATLHIQSTLNIANQSIAWMIQSLNIFYQNSILARLNKPTEFIFSKTALHFSPFCFQIANGSVCGFLNDITKNNINGQLIIKNLQINALSQLFNKTNYLHGMINANLVVNNAASAGFDANLTNLYLATGNTNLYFDNTTSIQAQLDKNTLRFHANYHSQSKSSAKITGDIKAFNLFDPFNPYRKLYLNFNFFTQNLTSLSKFFPEIQSLTGQINANGTISGELASPDFQANLKLENAQMKIPKLNISLTNINLLMHAKNKLINYQASLTSKNILKISGKANLATKSSETEISGQQILLSNTSEWQIEISPKLLLSTQNKNLKLSGQIEIPQALIKPYNFSDTITMPTDVTYTPKIIEKPKPYVFSSQIKLILGNEVAINFKGLTGNLTGTLDIFNQVNNPIYARGMLTLNNGKYDVYGQTLNVSTGELRYINSPIDNPNINFKAVRTIKINPDSTFSLDQAEITVGVWLTNQLQDPKIRLFSIPSNLAQTDILSYLLLGQPANGSSGTNIALLLRAAKALNLGGSSNTFTNFVSNLQHRFGLNQFDFESSQDNSNTGTTSSTTSLVLGKYLTPKLYLSYSFGLVNAFNVFRARYELTKHWFLQTENSTEGNGADILYRLEK